MTAEKDNAWAQIGAKLFSNRTSIIGALNKSVKGMNKYSKIDKR